MPVSGALVVSAAERFAEQPAEPAAAVVSAEQPAEPAAVVVSVERSAAARC